MTSGLTATDGSERVTLTDGAGNPVSVTSTSVTQGSTTSGQSGPLTQGAVTTAAPTYTTGQTNPLSLDTAGNLRVNVVTGGSSGVVAQGSTTSGETGMLIQGAVTTAAPAYTTAQTSPLSLTTAGAVRVDASATTQPVSGAVASGGANANNPVKTGAVFNTTQPTVTNAQVVDLQATARGARIVASGVDGFMSPTGDAAAATSVVADANMLFNGATWDRQKSAAGATGVAVVNTEGTKATYSQTGQFAATSTAGDLMILTGSGTKTVRVTKIGFSGTLTTALICLATVIRRSTAATGGTTIAGDTVSKHDTNNAAPTATVTFYTVGPTPGTNVGVFRRENVLLSTTATAGQQLIMDFTTRNEQGLVIRGTSDFLTLSLGSAAAQAGSALSFEITWTEE